MARDIEFNVTASDKTERGLTSAERNIDRHGKKIQSDVDKMGKGLSKTLLKTIDSISPQLASSLAKGFSSASSAIAPVLAGMAVVAVPFIAATISAAVIGGAGIGGVIGGVLLAARDPRVKEAGSSLGKSLLQTLTQQASVFIEPVLHSIGLIQSNFTAMGGDLRSIFQNASKFVEPLTRALLSAVRSITTGVRALVSKAGPVIDVISQGIAALGDAIGDVFEELSQNGPAAAVALKIAFGTVELAIRGVGAALEVLTKTFGFLAKVGAFGPELQRNMITYEAEAKIAADATQQVAASFDIAKFGAVAMSGAISVAAAAAQGLASSNHTLFDSATGVGEALARVKKSFDENGKSMSANTEKGRANRTALSGLASALNANYDAFVKVNGQGSAANKVASSNYNSFIKSATGAGIASGAAKRLAAQLGLVPGKKVTNFVANTDAARARAIALQNKIDAIHGKTVTITINEVTNSYRRVHDNADRLKNSASDFAAATTPTRIGGPTPINVESRVQVDLDGRPFFDYVDKTQRAETKRQNHRDRVGRWNK